MNAFFGGQPLDAWLTTGSAKAQRLVRKLQELRDAQNAADKEARNRFGITSTTPTTTKPNTTDNDPLNPDDSAGGFDGGDSKNKWSLDNDAAFLAEKRNFARNSPTEKSPQNANTKGNCWPSKSRHSKPASQPTKNPAQPGRNSKYNSPTNSSN